MLSQDFLSFAAQRPVHSKTEFIRNAQSTHRFVFKVERAQQRDKLGAFWVLNFHADIGSYNAVGTHMCPIHVDTELGAKTCSTTAWRM